MNIRPLAVLGTVVAIGISTGVGAIVVSAQGPPPPSTPPPPARGPLVEFAPSWSRQEEFPAGRWQYSGAMAGAAAVVPDLGEPGLSFRYVETFGVTEEAYSGDMAHLNGPTGLFIDGSDNLFVAEWSGARALKYDATGTGLLTIGKAGFHNAQDYSFENPAGISVDSSGRIWVVDESPDRVTYYDSSGVFQGEVGVRWESGTGIDRLNAPRDAAFDSSGKLYIADTQNHRVQVFDFVGGSPVYSDTIGVSGVSGTDSQHFSYPTQLAFDSIGRLYVLDRANWRIQRCEFATGWVCSTFFGETGVSGNDLSHLGLAFGIGIDSND
ncbi:MAG: NHL repeat-containing protein, partial [Anaerolineales bacterium]